MRRLASVLVLATAAWSCDPVVDPECVDRDLDRVCHADDSDDDNPNCGADGTDADGDGHCVGFDCDDSVATGAACVDGCMDVWTDADGDGFGDPAAVRGACMAGGPGVVAAGGLADCDDTPGTGRTRVPIDFDGDGANACDDCDELDVRVYGGNVERCDGGLDNDCDPATDETMGDPDGDGILGCADLCPMQGATAPLDIVWEWAETNTAREPCGACPTPNGVVNTGTYEFKINGARVGSVPSMSPQCQCTPPVQQLATPATGWAASMPANELAFDVISGPSTTNNLVGWVRARLRYPGGGEQIVCLFDSQPGGDCTRTDLCGAGFCDANGTCSSYPACDKTQFGESVTPAQIDMDRDGAGSTCDCDDRSPDRSPSRLELCTNRIDDDCDGLADDQDPECATCRRTALSEAGQCGNNLDDDCDGMMDHADADCAGTVCPAAQPIHLLRDSAHERRTGSFDLCRMAPEDTGTMTPCERGGDPRDHWQLLTVHDPLERGYRVQYCYDGVLGELLTAEPPYVCGDNLTCAMAFTTAGPNNCVTEPATGMFVGTRTMPVVFRAPATCGAAGATVSWRISVLPP